MFKKRKVEEILEDISQSFESETDGGYTGKPADGAEPVQDADDL